MSAMRPEEATAAPIVPTIVRGPTILSSSVSVVSYATRGVSYAKLAFSRVSVISTMGTGKSSVTFIAGTTTRVAGVISDGSCRHLQNVHTISRTETLDGEMAGRWSGCLGWLSYQATTARMLGTFSFRNSKTCPRLTRL